MKPKLWSVVAVVTACFPIQSEAVTSFYSLDRSLYPAPPDLVRFTSDPANPTVDVIGEASGLGSVHTTNMDLSLEGRLFAAPGGDTIYELDPTTGATVGSFQLSTPPIEGLAVSDAGLIYVSIENDHTIREVDFDAQTNEILVSHGSEIDDLDFDADGNLIGTDINQSGKIYHIPLDGSSPQLIATVPIISAGGPMTFSLQDEAFYFRTQELDPTGRQLWRLSWSGGLPVGIPCPSGKRV